MAGAVFVVEGLDVGGFGEDGGRGAEEGAEEEGLIMHYVKYGNLSEGDKFFLLLVLN